MRRTPKSSSSQRCWSMLSFFSSGLSDRPTASTTTTSSGGGSATRPSMKEKREHQEKGSAAAEGSTNDKKEDEEQSWIMLHDRDSTPFWFEKTTGYWTYDGITVYGPPAPTTAATRHRYTLPAPHQQQTPPPQQLHVSSQYVSNAQPAAAYYVPGPYTATQYAWKSYHSAGSAVPGTILGAPRVFF